MKKHIIVAIVIFALVATLGLSSNFIRWDETPLEQSILALPLGAGLLLEMPFFAIMNLWVGDTTDYVNYPLSWFIIPLIAGLAYGALYYLIVFVIKKTKDTSAI